MVASDGSSSTVLPAAFQLAERDVAQVMGPPRLEDEHRPECLALVSGSAQVFGKDACHGAGIEQSARVEPLKSEDLCREIKRQREKVGLSREQLARRAGVSRVFIYKVEAGERMPSWQTLDRLAKALGVTVRVALVRDRQRR